jgi:hypothetical protein
LKAEVMGGDSGQQPQTDVGRRCARGDPDVLELLVVVRRQMVRCLADKVIEVAPGLPRDPPKKRPIFRIQRSDRFGTDTARAAEKRDGKRRPGPGEQNGRAAGSAEASLPIRTAKTTTARAGTQSRRIRNCR